MIKYSVFVSSPYKSLTEERGEAISAILKMGWIPIAMESFSVGRFDEIKIALNMSDAMVVLLGDEYGSTDNQDISWTQREYEYAKEKGIHIFCIELPSLTALRKKEYDTLTEDEKRQCRFADIIAEDAYLCPVEDKTDIYVKLSTHFSMINFEELASGWERRIDENKWRRENPGLNFQGTWYSFHISEDDTTYLRIGEVEISQEFSSRYFSELTAKAFNVGALYDEVGGTIQEAPRKRTTWSADYELYQVNNGLPGMMAGVFSSSRNFGATFADTIIEKGGKKGIHQFDYFETDKSGSIHLIGGSFANTNEKRAGEIFLFRTREERDAYLKKVYPDVLQNNLLKEGTL